MEFDKALAHDSVDCSAISTSSSTNDHDRHSIYTSFDVAKKDAPRNNDSSENKLRWLRSQIIGRDAEFTSPFGRRHITYADHTASGRSLRFIEKYLENDLLPFYGNTHTSDSYVGHHTTQMLHEASNYVKKCLGGGKGDDALIFCGNGSTAAIKRLQEVMGISVPSILRERVVECLRSEERWVVFVGAYEHHSNLLSWRQSLAEVVEISLDSLGLIDMDSLEENLKVYSQQNRPILASCSACSNVTGVYTNTRAIARLVHEFGGFVCFNFAASGPYVKIDMRSGDLDGYDAVFLSTHKFLGGPGSPGVLLMSKALYKLKSSPPSTCGGGTVNYVNGYREQDTLYIDDIEEREDAGTPAIIAKARAALAFWVKEYIGYETIEQKEQIYIQRAIKRLSSNQQVHVLGNTDLHRQAILSFLVYSNAIPSNEKGGVLDLCSETGGEGKPLQGGFVAMLLNDLFGIQARGGCACAGPYGHKLLNVDEQTSLQFKSIIEKGYSGIKPGWTRVGFPYYMSEEEVKFILDAIEFVAAYGQRFLSMYRYSWRKGSWTIKKDLQNFMTETQQSSSPVSSQYKSYMETAHRVAKLLPKFPPRRRVPSDIDIDTIPFLV